MEVENKSLKPEPPAYIGWGILILVSVAMFGNYYIYDSISPVAKLLADQLGFSDSDIGMLNGIYSLPNIIMVLIGGLIIDRLGTRISTFIFAVLCFVGAALTAAKGDLYVMAAGRLVFGLGAESLIVGATTVISRWFKGKQLAFALGINITIARLGSLAAYNSPSWAKDFYQTWQEPLIIAAAMGLISVIAVILYWGTDLSAGKKYATNEVPKQDEVNIREIFSFSKSFWLLVLLCVTFYSAIFPFKTFAMKLFQDTKGLSDSDSGYYLSIIEASTIGLTSFIGLFVDYFGRRSLLMMLGSFWLIPAYLLIAHTETSLFIPMVIIGISFSLVPAIIWPSVALITDDSKLGTAYGVMTAVQALGLTVVNILVGYVNDVTGSYTVGLYIFAGLGLLGTVFGYMLKVSESGANGHGLEKGLVHEEN